MAGKSEGLVVVKVGPLGPFDNNAYVIIDGESGESIIVDMPQGSERVLEAVEGTKVTRIVLTHAHRDHWLAYDLVTGSTGAPVCAHEGEDGIPAEMVHERLSDGETLKLGRHHLKVIHTPGHTPGSICLLAGDRLIAGDTLFPGGPGHSDTPEELQQELRSIIDRLYGLPDETIVQTGHGDDTTIGASKEEYAAFASRPHPPDLCGDVTWT